MQGGMATERPGPPMVQRSGCHLRGFSNAWIPIEEQRPLARQPAAGPWILPPRRHCRRKP